jgi:hypothetical protein
MKILKKAGHQQPTKIQKRVASLATYDLITWVEANLPSIGKAIVHHQRDGIEVLKDAETNVEVLSAIVVELQKRMP